MAINDPIQIRIANWREDGAALQTVRDHVFILEQHVPVELEWDGLDADCVHVLAFSGEKPIGTARLLLNGHIGRMAVLKHWRNQGVGSAMLQRLLDEMRNRGIQYAVLNAQIAAADFYRRFGFQTEGEEFMDAGIPHVRMVLEV